MLFFLLELLGELLEVILGGHVAWSNSIACNQTPKIVQCVESTHGMICPLPYEGE